MTTTTSTSFLIQYEYKGGAIGSPSIFWNDHHRTYATLDAALAEFETVIRQREAEARRSEERGRLPTILGRYRIIQQEVTTVETTICDHTAPR